MAVRTVKRRGQRRLVLDIPYRKPDGTKARYRHDAEVQTLAAARAEERRRLAALAATGSPYELAPGAVPLPEPARPSPSTVPVFSVVAEQYLTDFAPSHLKASTRHGYTHVLRGFLTPRIGDRPIDAITSTVVRELDVELVEREVRPSTRRNVQAVLRSVLCRYAVEAKLLAKPPEFPKLPKVGTKVVSALTHEQVRRLLDVSSEAQRRAFMLAAYAGIRGGELRGLRWRDVNLDEGYLIVRQNICRGVVGTPKSGHERKVPLTEELLAELGTVKKPGRDAFVSLSGIGRRWTEAGLGNAFRRAAKRAGLEGWRLHDLRHFFVTALFRGGTPAPTVQALAGHADLSTTQKYAHVAEVDLRDAIRRLRGNSVVTEPREG